MQYNKLSIGITKAIDKIQRNFVWGTMDVNKKITRNDNLFNNKLNPIPVNLARERAVEFKLIPVNLVRERAVEFKFLAGKHKFSRNFALVGTDHRWIPPTDGVKLNIDGSFDYHNIVGGAGGLIRDKHGNWVYGFSAKFATQSPIVMEETALYLGLKMAAKLQCHNLSIVTDSATLAASINDALQPDNNFHIMCRDLL
ncbi:hypothetical protein CQW23_01267 [Capsicum baccatum]|uniref:RNase H type-1 domain-containing protein n=1 Tax=Capsicum baccatum TaxID=33114 RepID=A0A2G2XN36_CAPBA|nr:hypothetical protein CQW23_01267 [Capsicum baccatum]